MATKGLVTCQHRKEVLVFCMADVLSKEQRQKCMSNIRSKNSEPDQPATSEDENNPGHVEPNPSKQYQFGWLYHENGEFFIKINLQVRFK